MELQAVLWDLDGSLVVSEHLWDEAAVKLAERLGGCVSSRTLAQSVGIPVPDTARMVLEDTHQEITPAAIAAAVAQMAADVIEAIGEGVPLLPGAADLLGSLGRAGYPMAVVTSTPRAVADRLLAGVGPERFPVVVCGDEVDGRTKPDPYPYIKAADLLGVDPNACIVVEDSPAGVMSARGAGCTVLAVPRPEVTVPTDERTVTVASLVGVNVERLRAMLTNADVVAAVSNKRASNTDNDSRG